MKFRVLSHAGLEVKLDDKSILCDPWVVGSTYWRSWWNYPPCSDDLVKELTPSAIYLTHVHWDHFAAPSLRKFSPDTLILLPKEPTGRMAQDLDDIGFHNYLELDHGQSVNIGKIKLTSYQFWIFTDSAVVIESDDTVLLNANDAKLMGGPLDQILKKHPKIDFVFRSHSSANSRVMYEFIDATDSAFETRDNYIEDFVRFTKATGAQYAIPFASNHCHLHKDVYSMNEYIVTPKEVESAWKRQEITSPELKIMVSGDAWNSDSGFLIKKNDYFENREHHIELYRNSVQDKLDKSYEREARAKVDEKLVTQYFNKIFDVTPWLLRLNFKGVPILYVLNAGEEITLVEADLYRKSLRFIDGYTDESHPMQIHTNTALFKHCLMSRLFSHLSISKRVKFRTTKVNLKRLRRWGSFLNLYEYDYLPVRKIMTKNFFNQWRLRWRELFLYSHIMFDLITRRGFRYINYLPKRDVANTRFTD